jgi:GxxExxY protein
MLENPAGLNALTKGIIGAGLEVHRTFGPGLLEAVYSESLAIELTGRGMRVDVTRRIPLSHHGIALHTTYEPDLIVDNLVIVEVKAIAALLPVHRAQVKTYLKLTGCPVGLLMNFNVTLLKEGIQRVTGENVVDAA